MQIRVKQLNVYKKNPSIKMALGVGLHPSDGFLCFVIDVNLAVSSCGTNGILA